MAKPESITGGSGSKGAAAIGCAGKVVMSLFFGAFLGMGLLFEVLVLQSLHENILVHRWTRTPCEILTSQVETLEDGRFRFDLLYAWKVGGRQYRGTRLDFQTSTRDSFGEAQADAARYPAGTRATCLVDPANPSLAVLEAPSPWGALIALFPLIFVAVGLGGLVFVWRGGRPKLKPDGTPVQAAISSEATKKGVPRWAIALFSGVFLVVGAGAFYAIGVRPALKLLAARDWREVGCTVVSSEVRSHRGDDSTTYSVYILYAYEVDGREFRSDRYDFMGGSSSGYEGKAEVVARYPPGSPARCFVDPANPGEAVLDRQFRGVYLLGLLPLLFVAAGFGGLLYALRKGTARGTPPIRGAADAIRFAETDETWRVEEGAVVLPSRGAPVAVFFTVLLIALFWNGIVSVFVWQAVASFRRGDPEWGLTLFLVPFVLIGLALVGGVGYQFLALFNPRVKLVLQTSPVLLGTPEAIAWEVSGNADRLSRLTLTCEGREEATYRRGTRTNTDRSPFARIVIADMSGGGQVARGRTDFTVPDTLVPTFGAPNNKIVWSLKVRGEVHRWPDVNEEFELTVLPRGGPS